MVLTREPGDRWQVVVIGAGAAGAMAGIHAARAGADTLVLESARRPGAKIRVSGGGRCNVLPSRVAVEDFHTEGSVHALRRILRSWPLDEVTSFFADDLGVELKTEDTGKVFPVSDDADEVVRALLDALADAGATLRTGVRVTGLEERDGAWSVALDTGEVVVADRVVLATGGLSLPKTGSDGAGYEFAAGLGHDVLPRYPALVPIRTTRAAWGELAGIAVPATVEAWRGSRVWSGTGDLLITHHGFSGPVALDASHQVAAPWATGTTLSIHFGDGVDWDAELAERTTRTVRNVLADHLPRRLADHLVELADLSSDTTTATLRREESRALLDVLQSCPVAADGTEGYRVAEVTGGGLRLEDLDPRSLQSRLAPGLHVAGEAMDVTGRLGGYNFHWAWVTGRAAGIAAARGAHTG